MLDNVNFDLDKIDDYISNPSDFKVLARVPISKDMVPYTFVDPYDDEKTATIIVVDLETTGLDVQKDVIVEICLAKVTYSLDRKIILSIDDYYDGLEDPGFLMSDDVIKIHGISNEMVKDHSIDDDIVASFCSDNVLVVAHNASFDRKFFEQRFPNLDNLPWACSFKGIDWTSLGFDTAKLTYLNILHGYFYDEHRSFSDVFALIWLLLINNTAFAMLINSAYEPSYRIEAFVPFDLKDEVKKRGFRFNPAFKTWYFEAKDKAEMQKLADFLECLSFSINYEVTEFNARNRFK